MIKGGSFGAALFVRAALTDASAQASYCRIWLCLRATGIMAGARHFAHRLAEQSRIIVQDMAAIAWSPLNCNLS